MTAEAAAYRGRTKYTEKTAREYQERPPVRHRAEMRLVERAFALVPKTHRVLDVPCGGGRVTIHLAQRGYNVSSADLSEAMLAIARQKIVVAGFACPVERQDVERFTYPDRHFDTLISFRLFHHFPNADIRSRVVSELCRVARKFVVLSYFSPASVTSVKRKLRVAMGGRKSEKHPTSLAEVENYFSKTGFRLVKDFARMPLIHTLHLAVFERVGESRP
jgi:ubiquinone/menaquinone biosynthesis C-methylase UbiE